uniref:Uncharacterized protein n=1 Tax=Anguilla anguilla TaxID=7936 RepID=A0A0E9U7I8_ANGAN
MSECECSVLRVCASVCE